MASPDDANILLGEHRPISAYFVFDIDNSIISVSNYRFITINKNPDVNKNMAIILYIFSRYLPTLYVLYLFYNLQVQF